MSIIDDVMVAHRHLGRRCGPYLRMLHSDHCVHRQILQQADRSKQCSNGCNAIASAALAVASSDRCCCRRSATAGSVYPTNAAAAAWLVLRAKPVNSGLCRTALNGVLDVVTQLSTLSHALNLLNKIPITCILNFNSNSPNI